MELAKSTLFAWEATERSGGDFMVDAVANPSAVEFARKEFEVKKAALEASKKGSVLDRYGTGGAESADADHEIRRLAAATTEAYVEYGRDGRVVRGAAKAVAKSKYPEDVLHNNHTQVWGSWFDVRAFRWGFGDDHSLEKNSYSTGEAGRAANEAAAAGLTTGRARAGDGTAEGGDRPMLALKTAEEREASAAQQKRASRAELYGEQLNPDLDADKLAAAIAKVPPCAARPRARRPSPRPVPLRAARPVRNPRAALAQRAQSGTCSCAASWAIIIFSPFCALVTLSHPPIFL